MRTFYCCVVILFCLITSFKTLSAPREDSLCRYDKLDSSDIIAATFSYKAGIQDLGNGIILNVPAGYRLLDASQTRVLVEHLWSNPEDSNTRGMLLPERMGPMDKNFRGIVITFEPSGHLEEQVATKINYNKLLLDMEDALRYQNVLRRQKGAGIITGMYWAFPPFFDKRNHLLHWGRVLRFENNLPPVLNYEIRLLGRRGAICFTAIGKVTEMQQIRKQLQMIIAATHFTNGNTYADFNPNTDPLANWAAEDSRSVASWFSPARLLLAFRSLLLMTLLLLCITLFVVMMQVYHQLRRKPTYRKIDERLN
ncbi:DUF2167 domain-containing protein [Chitinophaga sp. 30R24]|uniref:DUF2167 domain-containing protein n=1 Tax=Chitinophaga sp. 30R24 TaxID=3248838 RepID=UPI003B907028